MLRAGVIGLGVMGRHHARVISAMPEVHLVGACDTHPSLEEPAFPVFSDLDQLLGMQLDYCVIAVPTSEHLPVAMSVAKAQVAALIEKPIAIDLESAESVREAFDSRGLIAGVGHIERFNPAVQQARERIEAGQLGEVLQVATVRESPFPGRLQDVGVALDLGTHDFNLTQYLTGSRYESISARTRQLQDHAHEDLLTAVGQLDNGVVTNHLVSWLAPRKERVVSVLGERGMFRIDTLSSDLTFYENGDSPNEWGPVAQFRGISQGSVTQYAFPKREPLVIEHEAFCQTLLGESSAIVTLEDGIQTLRVALNALVSAETGRVITVGK